MDTTAIKSRRFKRGAFKNIGNKICNRLVKGIPMRSIKLRLSLYALGVQRVVKNTRYIIQIALILFFIAKRSLFSIKLTR